MKRIVATIVIGLFAALSVAASAQTAAPRGLAAKPAARLSPRTTDLTSPTTLIPDDGDVAQELKYPWQDDTFSHDEQRQMGYILVFLFAIGGATGMRRMLRSRRYAAFAGKERGNP
jgi:hypothetical protein